MKKVQSSRIPEKKRRALLVLAMFLVPAMMGSSILVLSEWNPAPGTPRGVSLPMGTVSASGNPSVSATSPVDAGQGDGLVLAYNDGSVGGTSFTFQWYVNGNEVDSMSVYYPTSSLTISETYTYTPPSAGTYSYYGLVVGVGSSGTVSFTVNAAMTTPTIVLQSQQGASSGTTASSIDAWTTGGTSGGGANQYSIVMGTSGGTSPYNYNIWITNSGGTTVTSWNSGFGYGTTATAYNNVLDYLDTPGSYTAYGYITDSAGAKTSTVSYGFNVVARPAVSISSNQNPTDTGNSFTLSGTVTGGVSPFSYQWYTGTAGSGTAISGATASTYTVSESSGGSYNFYLIVTDQDGESPSSSTLTETINNAPTVSASSNYTAVDVGNSVTLTALISGGTAPYSYQWYLNGNAISGESGSTSSTTLTYSPPSFTSSGTYQYDVQVKDNVGDSATSNTILITVNSDPTVTASIANTTVTGNNNQADVGFPIGFDSSPNGGTGSYTYSWTLNGNQLSTSQDFVFSFSSPGNYTLTITITDSMGKTSSATVSVKINPNPSVSISSSQNPTDVGNSVTFTSSVSGGTGTDTYVWTINGVQESTASGFSYSFSSPGIFYVNVTVTDSDGHTATYSLKETVNPDPSVVIHAVHNPTDVGIWANFSSSVSGGTGPYTYSWSLNGQSYTSSYVNYTFTSSGTFPVDLTVTDANGNQASYTVNEVVNPDPTVAIQASYQKVDQGINDTFSASVTGGTSPFNYTWTLGSKILNYSQQFHMNFTQTGSYVINLTMIDSLGEKASSSFTVQVIQKPSALIEGSNKTDVSTTTYWEGYGSYGTAPYNYYWYLNGVNTSSGLYLQYSFPKTGEYNITLLIDDSQGSKAYAYLNITVENLPKIALTESKQATDVGIPAYFNSSISGGTPFFNYTWSISGIGTVGYQKNLEYSFSSPGKYNVTLQVYDGSGNSASSSIAITISALPKASINAQYPNIDPNVTDSFDSNVTGGTPGFSYSWYVNGTLQSTAGSMNYSFASPGIYPVKLIVTDSQGQSSSYVMDITVVHYPRASIIYSSDRLDANVTDQFRASGSGGIGPYSYEWVIAGQTFSNSTVTYSFASQGNYTVQLVISDYFGKDASSTVKVDVYPDPAVKVAWNGTPVVSEPFNLSASVTGGIAPYSVSWVFPSGQRESGTLISHVFSSSGPRTFQVQISDGGGFQGTQNFSISVRLFVSVSDSTSRGLGPLNEQFYSSALGGSDYSYAWNFGNGNTSVSQDPSQIFGIGNYSISLKVTSANGAMGYASLTIQSLPAPVEFSWSPSSNITVLTTVNFSAHPNWDASGPYSMSWSFPNGQTLTGMNISYRFPVYQEFDPVIAQFHYGNRTWDRTLNVRMVPASPVITFNPPSIVPQGNFLSLNASASAPDSSSFHYRWDIAGSLYYGQDQLFYANSTGNFSISVTVTDSLGANSTATRVIGVLKPGTNSTIAISYSLNSAGPMDYYTVKVVSLSGIQASEAFMGSQSVTLKPINDTFSNGTETAYYNLTMDQRDYNAGSYGIQVVVFNNNSQSNSITMPFSVSSQFSASGGFTLGSLINMFGGISNFIIILLTLGSLAIAYATLREKDNPSVTIDGVTVQGKKR